MALRVFFGLASFAILILCLINYWVEWTPEWKSYQRAYYEILAERTDDPIKAAEIRQTPPSFEQIYNADLNITDRCTICHLGIENNLMDGAPAPHKVHPGDFLKTHQHQEIGCTICHGGQGRATTLLEAHGLAPHWDRPLLSGDFVQSSCSTCHHEDEIPKAPILTRGKRLLHDLGCTGCHIFNDEEAIEKVGPNLQVIGSKVSRRWLIRWLLDPRDYLPEGKMPYFGFRPEEARALAAYLASFRDASIDEVKEIEGDYDAGEDINRRSQCVTCHVTREDYEGNPVGGRIGPDLRRVGNKVTQSWLIAFFQNPHAFYPNTKMPRFNLGEREAKDLAQFVVEEWVDYDLLDADEQAPALPPDTPELVEAGERLFAEYGCGGCHDLPGQPDQKIGPDLTYVGSKNVHEIDFGEAEIPHTLPDYLFTKLRDPRAIISPFRLPVDKDPAEALWQNMHPKAVFSKAADLPDGSTETRLRWIYQQAQQRGVFSEETVLPDGPPGEMANRLVALLDEAGALTPLKMPDFRLSEEDAEALTIALLSHNTQRIASRRLEVPAKRRVIFNPQDVFGELVKRYRCLSCHTIRGSGELLAADLTLEGTRVQREWLYHFLKKPYSMRRMITIAMPIFEFPDEEARFMAEYISRVFVDRQVGEAWTLGKAKADAARGEQLFQEKGCLACHQLHGQGGDVGPSLTTQVPDFPVGTWVGDKLRGEWIYAWLKDPQSILPDTIEPKLDLTDQEALDLTAYLLSLKSPDVSQ